MYIKIYHTDSHYQAVGKPSVNHKTGKPSTNIILIHNVTSKVPETSLNSIECEMVYFRMHVSLFQSEFERKVYSNYTQESSLIKLGHSVNRLCVKP